MHTGPSIPNMADIEAATSSECPFLDLPRRLRLRVYSLLCVLGHPRFSNFINLSSAGAPDRNHNGQRFINTHRLLLTCKTVYNELVPLVYGFNHFFIRLDDHGSFGALRRLRPSTLCAMRNLTIHINVSSCGLGDRCGSYLYPWERHYDDYDKLNKPLSLRDAGARVRQTSSSSSYNTGSELTTRRPRSVNGCPFGTRL
jgi:hypothetical protein